MAAGSDIANKRAVGRGTLQRAARSPAVVVLAVLFLVGRMTAHFVRSVALNWVWVVAMIAGVVVFAARLVYYRNRP